MKRARRPRSQCKLAFLDKSWVSTILCGRQPSSSEFPRPFIGEQPFYSIPGITFVRLARMRLRLRPSFMKNMDKRVLIRTSVVLVVAFTATWWCFTDSDPNHSTRASAQLAGKAELVLQAGHAMGVEAMAFSPDGKWLASGSADNTVRIWEVASGREVRTLAGHTRAVKAVTFSRDGHLLATGSVDDTVRLWNLDSGRESRRLIGCGSVSALALSDDGRF